MAEPAKSPLPPSYAPGITICVPAFNEEATIEQAVLDADLTLKQTSLPGEILVIDDCSTDRTWQILCHIKDRVANLKVRRHSANQGIARTFGELYQWAGNELVFLNSADGQWKMNALLELLPMMRSHDIIVARRRNKHYGFSRQIVSWLFNLLPVIFFATRTYDAGSVKLVRRAVYDLPIVSSGVFAEAERIIRATRQGYRLGVKEIDSFPRRAGMASGAKLSLVIEGMLDLIKCWFEIVVLRRN